MNDKTTDSSDVLVVEPVEPDTSEEEARSSVFAAFMAAARALKPGDDAGIQDLMYKAVWPKRSEPKLTELKLTDLQAEMLIQAIHTSTGFKLGVLRKTWAKFLKEARAEEEAATSAGPGGAGGAGAGPSGSYGPSGGFNQSFAGAFGQFCLDETGLYWRQKKKWSRIAGPFEILGYARDVKSEEWGEVIKFANKDKLVRKEIVTAALLYDDPNAVISRLGSLGMWISGVLSERRALIEYLLLEFETDKRATVVRRIGWFEIGAERVFVLPDEIIGVALSEQIILEQDVGAPYARRGTVEEWRNAIAKPAGDHLMARFVISTGLSGTLLYLGGFESGITHLKGDSSIGKTTLLKMAASTWGSGADNGFVRKWRSTDNALEATLSSSNDTLLPLDEIGQVDVRVIGQIVYMVASNVGKQRMRRDATVRSSHQWRTLVLSSGEKPIAILLAEGHSKRAHAGQLVRAIDVPAKRTKNSAFDRPNPTFDSKAFVEDMKRAASTYYGTAGPEFVRLLVNAKIGADDVRSLVDAFTVKALESVKDDSGQAHRAAQRFGIAATAGELAIELGLLPWPKGQLIEDALILFKAWLSERGGAEPAEIRQMIAQARLFMEAHSESRFDLVEPSDPDRKPVNNRAGYRKGEGDDRRWYVTPEVWRSEICDGFDPIDMAKLLIERGMMEPGEGNHLAQKIRLPKLSPQRLYVLKPSIFEG